jgi:hypothetical protein
LLKFVLRRPIDMRWPCRLRSRSRKHGPPTGVPDPKRARRQKTRMTSKPGNETSGKQKAAGDTRAPRFGVDRRRKTIPALRYLVSGGQRRGVRRVEDKQRLIILDRYSPRLLKAIVGILFLSLLDAILTLSLIEHGATEINPVMAFFLKQDPLIFTGVKYLLTSLAVVIFLLVNHNVLPRTRFRMSHLFTFAIASFAIVVVWEIVLIYIIATRT